jgi:hypothetical protein
MGIYNDVSADKTVSDTITPAIFWPMWAGIATPKQATTATSYLADPKMFAAKWPAPSVALGDPRFTRDGYWRGPTWVNLNWITIRGLQRCGQKRPMGKCGYREPLNLSEHTSYFLDRRFLPLMPLPQRITDFRPEQVRCEQLSGKDRHFVIHPRGHPFHGDAGV